MRRKTSMLACTLALLFATTEVRAQLDLGQIVGAVRDASQALVAGATVTARNVLTNNTVSTKTESGGLFVFVNVAIGQYEITVEAPGFKKFVRSNIIVNAARRTDVDFALEVGAATESVTVTASAAMLAVDTAVMGGVVENRQMTDIAMNGRNPFYMAEIKPGVVGDQFNSFNPDTMYTGLKINGGQGHSNAVTVDGVNFERMRGDYNSNTQLGVLNVDAIQEVQILTSTYPAEYGRAKDAQIRFVTKSGTRDFHGTVFEFFRNKALDANSWTRNNSTQAFQNAHPAPLTFNQPGFSLGGPFVIPRKFNTDRKKLFFFFSEEWMYWRANYTTANTVPSPLMRQGNFSELLNSANPFFGAVKTIKDPTNSTPFPGNIIPPSRLSPNGIALLNSYPLPTPGYQQGNLNVIQSEPDPVNQWKDTTHWDYYQGKNKITFAGTYYWYEEFTPFQGTYSSTNNVSGLDRSNRYWTRPNMTGTVSLTSTIRPTAINDISLNAGADMVHINVYPEGGVEKYDRRLYGINFPYVFSGIKVVPYRIPSISITGFTSEDGGSGPQRSSGPFYQLIDNFTWVARKNHTLKFGVMIEHGNQSNGEITGSQNGSFAFLDTGSPNTSGVAIGNVALGNYNTYSENGVRPYTQVISWDYEAYGQDTWKVTPDLTLEMGLRYTLQQPWHARWHDTTNFEAAYYNPANAAVVDPVTGYVIAGDPYNGLVKPGTGIPKEAAGRALAAFLPNVDRLFHNLPLGFYNSPRNAFAPRLGVAYRINNKTVFRTGAGLFHARDNLYGGTMGQPPDFSSFSTFYGSVDNPGGATGSALTTPFGNSGMNLNQKYPTSFSRSASIQRELPGTIVLDIGYVGKTGMNIGRFRNINQLPLGSITAHPTIQPNAMRPFLGLANMTQYSTDGHSSYNSLQVTLERRFSSGLGFGLSYTWSKATDNIGTPYDANQFQSERSAFDYPHNLTVNYIYELPILRNSKTLAGKLLSSWQISGVTVYRSGSPLSVTDGTDMAGVGPGSGAQVWNCVGSPAYSGATGVGLPFFNKAAFAMPAAGTWGNCGYNILRGPAFVNWDLALFKGFKVVERVRTEFRAEFFNFPNHPVLQNPGTSPRSGSFGVITQKGNERNIQFGVKFLF